MKCELVIVWWNGEKNVWQYENEEQAEEVAKGMKIALGEQVSWYGIRPVF